MLLLYVKALHIIFVVTWFAGLFYIVRLFVYHAEALEKPEPEKSILIKHFKGAERRLWYGITWPSMILTYVFGFWYALWMVRVQYAGIWPGWLVLKLSFVGGLTIYHLLCGRIFRQFQKDKVRYSGFQMRLWNEVATLFLVSIIFMVILKDMGNWVYGLIGMVIFSLLLVLGINIYKKVRERNPEA